CTNLTALAGGKDGVIGRARFRTLMGRLRAVRGLHRMARRLEEDAAEDDERPQTQPPSTAPPTAASLPPTTKTPTLSRIDWRKTARSNLVALIRGLDDVLMPLRKTQRLGLHARALVDVTKRLARKSAARGRLVQMIMPWSADGGPPISLGELADEVRVLLDADAPLSPLVDAAV